MTFECGWKRDFDTFRSNAFGVILIRLTDNETSDVRLETPIVQDLFQATCSQMNELIKAKLVEAEKVGPAVETVIADGDLYDPPSIKNISIYSTVFRSTREGVVGSSFF